MLEMPTRVNWVPGVHDKVPPNDRWRHAPFESIAIWSIAFWTVFYLLLLLIAFQVVFYLLLLLIAFQVVFYLLLS